MIRLIAVMTMLAPVAVWADPPHFSTGGFNFQIQYGPGFWTVDATRLGNDPGKERAGMQRLTVGPGDQVPRRPHEATLWGMSVVGVVGMMNLANAERATAGLPPLVPSTDEVKKPTPKVAM